MKKVMLLHGVNHNMFGKRDPKQYGTITLDGINKKVDDLLLILSSTFYILIFYIRLLLYILFLLNYH